MSIDRDAIHVFHREPRLAGGRDAAVDELRDVGMIETRKYLALLEKPLHVPRITGAPRRKNLQSDEFLVLLVGTLRQINGSHPTPPELAKNSIRTERR